MHIESAVVLITVVAIQDRQNKLPRGLTLILSRGNYYFLRSIPLTLKYHPQATLAPSPSTRAA